MESGPLEPAHEHHRARLLSLYFDNIQLPERKPGQQREHVSINTNNPHALYLGS